MGSERGAHGGDDGVDAVEQPDEEVQDLHGVGDARGEGVAGVRAALEVHRLDVAAAHAVEDGDEGDAVADGVGDADAHDGGLASGAAGRGVPRGAERESEDGDVPQRLVDVEGGEEELIHRVSEFALGRYLPSRDVVHEALLRVVHLGPLEATLLAGGHHLGSETIEADDATHRVHQVLVARRGVHVEERRQGEIGALRLGGEGGAGDSGPSQGLSHQTHPTFASASERHIVIGGVLVGGGHRARWAVVVTRTRIGRDESGDDAFG